jgi:hypothetical protein
MYVCMYVCMYVYNTLANILQTVIIEPRPTAVVHLLEHSTLLDHNTGAACIHFLMQSPVVVAGQSMSVLFIQHWHLMFALFASLHSE